MSQILEIRKCPQCGCAVPALSTICPDCKFDLEGYETTSASQILTQKIETIYQNARLQKEEIRKHSKWLSFTSIFSGHDEMEDAIKEIDRDAERQIESVVRVFPIPSTKADLIEFITTMKARGFLAKYYEALTKADAMFGTDPLFVGLIKEHKSQIKKLKREMNKDITRTKNLIRTKEVSLFIALHPDQSALLLTLVFLIAEIFTLVYVFHWLWWQILLVSIVFVLIVFIILFMLLSGKVNCKKREEEIENLRDSLHDKEIMFNKIR